jgi:hypothetical protein
VGKRCCQRLLTIKQRATLQFQLLQRQARSPQHAIKAMAWLHLDRSSLQGEAGKLQAGVHLVQAESCFSTTVHVDAADVLTMLA